MNSFNITAEISGKLGTLLVVPEKTGGELTYRIIKDGVEFCTLKQNGDMGWEVNGTPLNADELNSIGQQINAQSF
jgi:hypothetical protein